MTVPRDVIYSTGVINTPGDGLLLENGKAKTFLIILAMSGLRILILSDQNIFALFFPPDLHLLHLKLSDPGGLSNAKPLEKRRSK